MSKNNENETAFTRLVDAMVAEGELTNAYMMDNNSAVVRKKDGDIKLITVEKDEEE